MHSRQYEIGRRPRERQRGKEGREKDKMRNVGKNGNNTFINNEGRVVEGMIGEWEK